MNKGGYTFVVDRTNGQFIGAWPIVRNINWTKGIDKQGNLIGRNEPKVGVPTFICPAVGGGRSWNHGAYSPRTGLFYSTGNEWCQEITARKEDPKEGQNFFGGVFLLKKPLEGQAGSHLDAYDPVSGKRAWSHPAKYPLLASVLATAGDLVFTGDPEGHFFALDAKTGAKLWTFQTGSGHRGSPVAYSVKGKEYIATPSGWGSAVAGLMAQIWPETEHFRGGSSVVAFTVR